MTIVVLLKTPQTKHNINYDIIYASFHYYKNVTLTSVFPTYDLHCLYNPSLTYPYYDVFCVHNHFGGHNHHNFSVVLTKTLLMLTFDLFLKTGFLFYCAICLYQNIYHRHHIFPNNYNLNVIPPGRPLKERPLFLACRKDCLRLSSVKRDLSLLFDRPKPRLGSDRISRSTFLASFHLISCSYMSRSFCMSRLSSLSIPRFIESNSCVTFFIGLGAESTASLSSIANSNHKYNFQVNGHSAIYDSLPTNVSYPGLIQVHVAVVNLDLDSTFQKLKVSDEKLELSIASPNKLYTEIQSTYGVCDWIKQTHLQHTRSRTKMATKGCSCIRFYRGFSTRVGNILNPRNGSFVRQPRRYLKTQVKCTVVIYWS
ncbi:hypothetical protein MAR_011769 [Mya arenaria]|uniref:Uncharacterized protein n=1 Tax=Mya arenaria TaxID=6604 RepID=A0ABY7FV15_MYAAR|nr:hypothetical protein MAR_011769 [Mya arenaria]